MHPLVWIEIGFIVGVAFCLAVNEHAAFLCRRAHRRAKGRDEAAGRAESGRP